MDRNQSIGLILIFLVVTAYYVFFNPTAPTPEPGTPSDTTQVVKSVAGPDTLKALPDSVVQAQEAARLGVFAAAGQGTEQAFKLENSQVELAFSSKGGRVIEARLKNYKSYDGGALVLFNAATESKTLTVKLQSGQSVDLYGLYHQGQVQGNQAIFTALLPNGASLSQIYTLDSASGKLDYQIKTTGLATYLAQEPLVLNWKAELIRHEPDINNSRITSTIKYYTNESDIRDMGESDLDPKTETESQPLRWVSFKEKFFNVGFISQSEELTGAIFSTATNRQDSSAIKSLSAQISIPFKALGEDKAQFAWHFGPNSYKELQKVAPGYERNVYMGWPVVNLVNRFITVNVFYFLESWISNYGIIIVILVILLKTALFPLSYRSYIGMAKMKVLKPEIDEIKEKHGDDMMAIQTAQSELYRQVGINPLMGCLPLLLQLPFIMAMFSFFPSAIELRQESLWWATDLSTYDSVLDLPFSLPGYGDHVSLFTILMTASTLVLTWYNNQTTTATGPMLYMSYVMPVVFMFVLNSFPAGLNFYYLVSNVVSIAQQVIIRSTVDDAAIRRKLEENRVKNATKKKSGFQQRLEEAMRAQEEARKNKEKSPKKK